VTGISADGAPRRVLLAEFGPSGGLFHFAFQQGAALACRGHHVVLVTGPNPELASLTPGFRVLSGFPTWDPTATEDIPNWRRRARRGWRALLLAESWRRLVVLSRRTRPDVVQVSELHYPLDSLGALALARYGRAALVVDLAHNPLPFDVSGSSAGVEKTGSLGASLLSRAYAACDLVLVLSEGAREHLLAAFPATRRTAVCGHGVFTALQQPGEGEPLSPPSAAGPSILFFGSWTRYKDLPLLLEAFALVRARIPDARLVVAGPVMPDVDVAALTAQAGEIGGVELRPGYVPMTNLPAVFGEARVVALPYSVVNVSGVVHLAYSFGRPVVATNVGSMADVVKDAVTGVLTEATAESFASGLLRVLEDDALADEYGEAAFRTLLGDSSWDAVAERIERSWDDIALNR
jgi:glycosyltransferase involved in cell wall biosynthesis